jgi:dTMP kinase
LANVVYQGCAGGIDAQQIWTVGEIATDGIMPDLTVILDIDPALGKLRQQSEPDRMEKRGSDYFQAVRQGFLDYARLHPEQVAVIDARKDIKAVQNEMRCVVRHVLQSGERKAESGKQGEMA